MPFPDQSLGNNPDDVWHRHESEIRLLYQTKSLSEVKREMDQKPGFPRMAIKTWHEKLGHHGIRKTVKNEEWVKVYRYCARYRLEDPSRKKGDKTLKRTKRKTEVILGDRKFTWDQAWKNMKRAGAIVEPQLDPPSPLPPDITVRTPPPAASSPGPHVSLNTLRPRNESITAVQSQGQLVSSECSIIQRGNTYLGGGRMSIQQSHLQELSPIDLFPSICPTLSDCLKAQMMLHLPGLPIWNLSNTLVEMAKLDQPSQKSTCETGYGAAVSLGPITKLTVRRTMLSETEISNESVFHLSDLFSSLTITQSSAALTTFGPQGRAYITVSVAIYLLSNNLVDTSGGYEELGHRGFFETLDSVFADLPARHLQALLQSRLASVRAAFEALLGIAGFLKQRFAFKSLVNIGTGNNWLSRSVKGHEYLYHAVCMDLNEVVQQLLESGCRPDKFVTTTRIVGRETTAIVEALERCNIQGVQLLLKHCDVNNLFDSESYLCITSFTFFIQKMRCLDERRYGQSIKLFLDAGADINSPLGKVIHHYPNHDTMWSRWARDRIWSVLDYLFCFHPRLFYIFTPNWSPAQASHPTRAGILMSLESGPNNLSGHCTRLAQNVGWACLYDYLELLVAEQLTGIGPWMNGPRSKVNLDTVRVLLDLGVHMDKVLSRAPTLLADYMESRRGESDHHCDMEVIRFLLDNRAIVDDRTLQQASRCQNTGLLALIIQNAADIQEQGADAVVQAATANDSEAVKILIDAGVDVNTDFTRNERLFGFLYGRRDEAVSLLCQVIELWTLSFEALNNMIDYLVQRGAHFRLSAMKPRLSDLLESVLKYMHRTNDDLLKKIVQLIIDAGCDLNDPEVPSARLLEASGFPACINTDLERRGIFEFMFRNGALLRPGAPLAAWIGIDGGAELVNEMLRDGVDINTYYHGEHFVRTALQTAAERCREDLVVLLLQEGANVNAPAVGDYGKTALQAICSYEPHSPAGKADQISIISRLLDHGANLDAAPARVAGSTALQMAAKNGYLEVAMLLLSWDPPADVNMPPCQYPDDRSGDGNALDVAARNGRLDMVKLLLNNYALSCRPGDTGYDGAIQAAENSGNLAIADLIREHATDVSISDPTRTHLSWRHRDWREYEYEYDDYSNEYTSFYESDEDDESSKSGDEQDPVAQVQIQPEVAVYLGPEHTAPEPGWVWDMEADNSLNFNIELSNPADGTESVYGLDHNFTSHIDTAAPGWGFSQ